MIEKNSDVFLSDVRFYPRYIYGIISAQFLYLSSCLKNWFFNKWVNPGLFLFIFGLFQTNIKIFATNICEKSPSSIQCWHLNPQPSELDSLLLSPRPGLLPQNLIFKQNNQNIKIDPLCSPTAGDIHPVKI